MNQHTAVSEAQEQAVVDRVPKQLFIGGRWGQARAGGTFGVEDPATGQVLCQVADADADDARAALDSAVGAQPAWGSQAPRERGEILRRAFEAIMERTDEFALLMTLEMGKPLVES